VQRSKKHRGVDLRFKRSPQSDAENGTQHQNCQ
jgi:hypothetical protein